MKGEGETALGISSEHDLVEARKLARVSSTALGFGVTDVTRIVTAASELARNIILYAGVGAMHCRQLDKDGRPGLELVFVDAGAGIEDVEAAMQPGFTTRNGLGLGLPGARRLMDEMELHSKPGEGTTIVVRKWLRR